MKRCFTCKRKKPLFLFKKNRMKYQLKSDMNRCVECRLCTAKRFINQHGKIAEFDFNIRKFQITKQNVSLINIIKQYIN